MTGIRPTNVNRNLYIKFGNTCRSNGKRIADVLETLMDAYIRYGDKILK